MNTPQRDKQFLDFTGSLISGKPTLPAEPNAPAVVKYHGPEPCAHVNTYRDHHFHLAMANVLADIGKPRTTVVMPSWVTDMASGENPLREYELEGDMGREAQEQMMDQGER